MLGNMELVIIGSAIAVIISIAWAVTKIKAGNVNVKGHSKNKGNSKSNGAKIKDLQRRERELKNKENSFADKQNSINQQKKILAAKEAELDRLTAEENKKLSTISGLSKDKAKKK